MSIPAAPNSTLPTGRKPGNIVYTGDSLSLPFPTYVQAWWKCQGLPLKAALPVGLAVFGWRVANVQANVASVNALYDGSAPWNVLVPWIGTNDIQAGMSAAALFAAMQTLDASCDARFLRCYPTLLPRQLTAPQETERLAYNAQLIATPLGSGTINLAAWDALSPTPVPNTGPWYADSVHLTTQGQGIVAREVNAFLTTLVRALP